MPKTPDPNSVPVRRRPVHTYLTALALGCLLPGVIGATLLFMHQYHAGRLQQERDTIGVARALVQATDSHLLRSQAVAQALATSDDLATGDLARFHRRARETIALLGLGTNIVLRDETGQQLLNTAVAYGTPLPRQPGLARVRNVFATGRPAVSDLFFGVPLRRPLVSADVPVLAGGRVRYALGLGIPPAQFNAILKAQKLPAGWVVAVLDRSGTIVGRNRSAERFVGSRVNVRLIDALRTSAEGSITSTTLEGTPVFSFYSRSAKTGWAVSIGIPRSDLRDALIRPLLLLAGGFALLGAISLGLAWFVGRRIARSVAALTGPARALGDARPFTTPHLPVQEAADVAEALARASDLLSERAATLRVKEAELAEALRLARFGTWYWDARTGAVETSPSVAEIYGREVPPFPEQRGTLLTVESWERVAAALKDALESRKGYDLELEVNHGDGSRIWIEAKCEAVLDGGGAVAGLRGTVQDITERKRHELALLRSEHNALESARQAEAERRRLHAVLEAAPVGFVVADANGAVLHSNAANKRLWGANHPEVGGVAEYEAWKGWWADGSERDGRPVRTWEWPLARALRGEDAPSGVIAIQPFDAPNERRIVLIHGAPVRDADGAVIGGVAAQLDITDRVRGEEALKQTDRRKDQFLAMLAHELRNPMAPISTAAQILTLPGVDEERVRRTSEIIMRQIKHMTELVNDLLDVSRVTRGLVVLNKEHLDLKTVVGGAVEQARPVIESRGHTLLSELPDAPVFVLADRTRLIQAVVNLLTNAAKYTPAGGRIALDLETTGDEARLRIADDGMGIEPALLPHLFELFTQAERTPDRSQGGLGLGLALVRSLIQMHNGRVEGHSDGLGKGSVFTLVLPLSGPGGAEIAHDDPVVPAGAAAPAPARIAVVDDNVDAADSLALLLRACGHEVSVYYDPFAALDRTPVPPPDAFILDIGLPGMDGYELVRRLRARPDTAGAVYIALTGYGQAHDRTLSRAAGFDHHFVKPMDLEALAEILGRL